MTIVSKWWFLCLAGFMALALAACQSVSRAAAPAATEAGEQSLSVPELVDFSDLTLEATSTPLPLPTATPLPVTPERPSAETPARSGSEPTFTPLPSPTPDVRLDPNDWKNWPVVPTISARAQEIYQRGLAMGANPRAFSKIGDCQMINEAFFGIYSYPDRYRFPKGYEYLQETIDYYAGMFGRISAAVRGGFVAPSILSPIWADPEQCEKGETPLSCEFRLNNPSVVLIGLEFWYEGRTPESYSNYLRQIIEYSIEHGAVPILITKADNVEGDHSINRATAQLAYEYDIPLWNFWLAVQPLPAHGMDTERNDGFHISVEAWNMRSFTGLLVLDAFRKAVQDLPPVQSFETR